MGGSTDFVPKLNDRDVIRAFRSVADDVGVTPHFSDSLGAMSSEDSDRISELAGFNLRSAVISLNGSSWSWSRLRADEGQHSALYDRLQAYFNDQTPPARQGYVDVSTKLEKALRSPVARARKADDVPIASHSQVLTEMQSVAAELIESTAHYRQRLDEAYIEKEQSLTQRIDEQRDRELERISGERDRVETELATRVQALDEQKRALDARQASLDDRNNTHVRREIRENLLAMTKDRLANFSLSKETRRQLYLVNLLSITGLFLLVAGTAMYGANIVPVSTANIPPAALYSLIIKTSVLAVTAIALGYWYLGWHNRWLQRIADAEFKLQQFRLDIERASWLAETVLEWKQTSKEPIPELLVTRLSNGLFQGESSDLHDPKSPATHLAEALFGAAASAKMKLGDQELQFDRKGIKRLEE